MERIVFERMDELGDTHWWFVARRRILDDVIRRIVRPPAKSHILEIGAGTGHNLAMLKAYGTVSACELDPDARALASERLGAPVLDVALPDLSAFPEAHFDLVALLDVLEHVRDDRGSLAAIRGRLKPGGALLLTVPANAWMWSPHDVAHHHHRRYAKAEIAAMAKEAGLEIALLSHFNTILFPLIAAARLAGRVVKRESADDSMPPRPLNAVLERLFGMERALVGRVPLPVGVSLVAVLRRPA
jgi:SAM-dependent methyltransferase